MIPLILKGHLGKGKKGGQGKGFRCHLNFMECTTRHLRTNLYVLISISASVWTRLARGSIYAAPLDVIRSIHTQSMPETTYKKDAWSMLVLIVLVKLKRMKQSLLQCPILMCHRFMVCQTTLNERYHKVVFCQATLIH